MIAPYSHLVPVQLIVTDADAHINGDDVSLPEPVGTGYPVDNLVIHGDTHGSLEAVEMVEGGIAPMLLNELFHLVVDLPGGDARLNQAPAVGSGLGGEPSGLSHQIQLMGGEIQTIACDHWPSASRMAAVTPWMVV